MKKIKDLTWEPLKSPPLTRTKIMRLITPLGWLIHVDNMIRQGYDGYSSTTLHLIDENHVWQSIDEWCEIDNPRSTSKKLTQIYRVIAPSGWIIYTEAFQSAIKPTGMQRQQYSVSSVHLEFVPDPNHKWVPEIQIG
jgi:hypothetical protein